MKDVYISSIFMPEFRFHSDVLLITFKKCQDSKESCREEDAVKKKEKGKKSKCTLKVGLQHFWDRLQISYCHKHRHAPWSKAHTAPIVWTADAGGRKILPAVLLNTEKSICFNSLWKKQLNQVLVWQIKICAQTKVLLCAHWLWGPQSKAIFSHKGSFLVSCLMEYFEPINCIVLLYLCNYSQS